MTSFSSIYKFEDFRPALKEIDEIHKKIKEIISGKTPSELNNLEREILQRELNRLKETISKAFKIEVVDIYIIEDNVPNAAVQYDKFVLPIGNKAYIFYLYKIIKLLTPKELTAVLIHEIGHAYYWFYVFLRNAISYSTVVGIIAAIVFSPLFLSLPLFGYILSFKFSRIAEEYADRFVVEVGYQKYYLSALDKMRKYLPEIYEKLVISTRKEIKVRQKDGSENSLLLLFRKIFSTHPTFEERICNVIQYTYKIAREKLKNDPKLLKEIKQQLETLLKKYKVYRTCKLEEN